METRFFYSFDIKNIKKKKLNYIIINIFIFTLLFFSFSLMNILFPFYNKKIYPKKNFNNYFNIHPQFYH